MNDIYLSAPVELTAAELDAVAGGQQSGLVNVDVGNVQVAVPVTAAVDVVANVLGRQLAVTDTDATAPGRIGQRN